MVGWQCGRPARLAGLVELLCSNIHAWHSSACGRPSRCMARVCVCACVAASDTGARKYERTEWSYYRSTATKRRTDRRSGVLSVPLGRAR